MKKVILIDLSGKRELFQAFLLILSTSIFYLGNVLFILDRYQCKYGFNVSLGFGYNKRLNGNTKGVLIIKRYCYCCDNHTVGSVILFNNHLGLIVYFLFK